MDRPAAAAVGTSRAMPSYTVAMVLAFAFCVVSGFSIGFIFLPVPAAMLIGLFLWRWKWAVAGLVSAALAGSLAYFLTAPLREFRGSTVRGGVTTEFAGCSSEILADVPLDECDGAEDRALAIAVGSALLVGAGTGFAVRVATRARQT
jgi:hypothetical protein